MAISKRLLLAVSVFLVLTMTHAVNGTRPLIVREDSMSEKPTEGTKEPEPVSEQRLELDEFSETEQLIVDKLKKKRTESTKSVLEVNPRISGAIRYEMQMLFDEESAGLTPKQVEERLDKIVSYLAGSSVILKGKSTEKVLNQLNQNEEVQNELRDTTNLTLALALAEAADVKRTYCIIYLCEYSIEWGLFQAGGNPMGLESHSPFHNCQKINGKCNVRFLKYDFYEDKGLPFRIDRDSVETNVLETDEEGNFSIHISYSTRSKMEQRRVAILARRSPSEGYSLVDFLSIGGVFPQQD